MARIKRHRVVPLRYSSSRDWNDVKLVVVILSLLIGANLYYFKPYNGWNLTKRLESLTPPVFGKRFQGAEKPSVLSAAAVPAKTVLEIPQPPDIPKVAPVMQEAAPVVPAVDQVATPVAPQEPIAEKAAESADIAPGGQRQYVAVEDPNKPQFDFKVETAETLFKEKDWSEPPVNQRFIFHNKMPKCGSTMFQKLLHKLSVVNKFTFMDVYEPGTRDQDLVLVNKIRGNFKPPMAIMKHHFWMNFTKYHLKTPTVINIVRNPVDWFASEYYFCRNGWERKPDYKGKECQDMSEHDLKMTLEECVRAKRPECKTPDIEYIEFICGNHEICKANQQNYQKKRLALEMAKIRLLKEYYIVGTLEKIEESLRLLEHTLPQFFSGVLGVFREQDVQEVANSTRTLEKPQLSQHLRQELAMDSLRYEMELFAFIQSVLYKKYTSFGFHPEDWDPKFLF